MQTITVELTLNAAYYQEHFKQNDISLDELKRELRRELKDCVNELNVTALLDVMEQLPVLPLTPKIVICVES